MSENTPTLMAPYGPSHEDYPNAPQDWNGQPTVTRGRTTCTTPLQWKHNIPGRNACHEIIGYPVDHFTKDIAAKAAWDSLKGISHDGSRTWEEVEARGFSVVSPSRSEILTIVNAVMKLAPRRSGYPVT